MLYYFKFVPNLGCLVIARTQRFPDAPEANANIPNSCRRLPMYHYARVISPTTVGGCQHITTLIGHMVIAPTTVGGCQCITTLW